MEAIILSKEKFFKYLEKLEYERDEFMLNSAEWIEIQERINSINEMVKDCEL